MKIDKRGVVMIPMESSIAPPIFFLIGAAAATIGAVVTVWGVSSESDIMAGVLPLLIGTPIALLSLRSWRAGPLRLVIDVTVAIAARHQEGGFCRAFCVAFFCSELRRAHSSLDLTAHSSAELLNAHRILAQCPGEPRPY